METRNRPYVLSLNGRAELRDPDGVVVALPTRKSLLLLAVLAVSAGERLHRTKVAATVWDGGGDKAGRESLRTALSAIRKALPIDCIEADRHWLSLRPDSVDLIEDGPGEFMAGFDNDWVVERRLDQRSDRTRTAISSAREEDVRETALAHAERACKIDPLDGEAVSVRADLLRKAGRGHEATIVEDAHRARLLRQLGILAEPRPEPIAPEHPLIAAAEWTLARDPEEACTMLAGTQNQWITLSVERALEFHQRVLAANPRPSRERTIVQAGEYFLLTLNGKLGPRLEAAVDAYREAVVTGENGIAARLVEAISYGYLSRGDFRSAMAFAREGRQRAQDRNDKGAIVQSELTFGIIEQHAKASSPFRLRLERIEGLVEEVGSPYILASFRNLYAGSILQQGRIDEAAVHFESARRLTEALGSERLRAWVLVGEADLYERTGDAVSARTVLLRFRAAAPGAGQSAVAHADDALFRINCQLREFDEAADALARGTLYRRRMGTVPSRFEQAIRTPSLRVLRDRLDPKDLKAAFSRAMKGDGESRGA